MSDKILKRNTDNFSIVDTVADVAVNPEFSKGYVDWKESRNTEKAFVWEAMNTLGDEIAETIYDNIVNYIDNVGNIDTCKVKALFSMSEVLGVTNNGFRSLIDHVPDELLHLMDLFSINKAFATKFKVNCSALTESLRRAAIANQAFAREILDTTSAVNDVNWGLSDEKMLSNMTFDFNLPDNVYRAYVSAAFYNCLSAHLFNTYDGTEFNKDKLTTSARFELPLYDTLFNNYDNSPDFDSGLKDGYINNLDIDLSVRSVQNGKKQLWAKYEKVENLKKANNRFDFNPYKIASDVMDGNDLLDNYYGVDREMVDLALEARADSARVYGNKTTTRYAYYHRKDAIDYLRFANSFYDATRSGKKIWYKYIDEYVIDHEYLVVSDRQISANATEVLGGFNNKETVMLNMPAISSVAKNLADLCFTIADIREKLKTQAQRNHMRGTFLLISYIVGEYIKKNFANTYGLPLTNFKHIDETTWNVDIIEYADTTEYYNLSTVTTPVALSGNTVNYRFWETDGESVTGIGLTYSDLDYFYLNTLNIKTATSAVSSFLNVIFELGADEGYIDRRTGRYVPKIVADDIYDKIEANFEELSAKYYMLSNYQTAIFNEYGGSRLGYDIYYNWKNMAHASYQVHPYLERFVEWSNLQYSIKSTYGGNSNEEVLAALRTRAISTILGEMGEILNIWDRNAIDSTGWKSRYETEKHNVGGRNGESNRLQHYDGVFYPSAVEEYYKMFKETGLSSFDEALSSCNLKLDSSVEIILSTYICKLANVMLHDALEETSLSDGLSSINQLSSLKVEKNGKKVLIPVPVFVSELMAFQGRLTSKMLTAEISSVIYENEKLAYDERYSVTDKWMEGDVGKYLIFNWTNAVTTAYNKLNLDKYDLSGFPFLAPYFKYVVDLHGCDAVLSNEFAEDKDRDDAEKRKTEILAGGFPETFYEKWYAQLNLPKEDVQRILARLIYYHDDIVKVFLDNDEMSETKNNASTKYDIFKYGLDKYSNSIILYKNSRDRKKPDYEYSRNQLGEVWFRFNAHPIGFPVFSISPVFTQLDHKKAIDSKFYTEMSRWMNLSGDAIPFLHEKKSPRFFFDMEMTPGYRFLTFAYCKHGTSNPPGKYEEIKNFMILKTWEDPFAFNDLNENLLNYYWLAPDVGEESDGYDVEGDIGEFQGMFEDTGGFQVCLLWAKYLSSNNSFTISKRVIPGAQDNATISFLSSGPCGVKLRNNIVTSAGYRLSYCCDKDGQGCYTLAFITDFDFYDRNSNPDPLSNTVGESEIPYSISTRYGQNYIGRNSIFTGEDTNFTTEFASSYYGVADYYHNPGPAADVLNNKLISNDYMGVEPDEGNSFDRLNQYLTLVDFTNTLFKGSGDDLKAKNYNLNPDASFIPSYCGLRGFMRVWAAQYYKQRKINGIKNKTLHSLELLGYSFNHIKEKIEEFSSQLLSDDEGNLIAVDPSSVLSSGFRVYEQYRRKYNDDGIAIAEVDNPFYREVYNPVIRFGNRSTANWEIDLTGLDITSETLSTFRVLLYVIGRGANCPIYACDLSALNNVPTVAHYCRTGTIADDYYLSNRYITPYIVGVFGTPNVLVDNFDPYMATGETNYIMGISSVGSVYDGANKKVTLSFTKHPEVVDDLINVQEMIIDKNTMVAMIYTDNLWEFNDYHMLYHHHGDWPFLSVWDKLPPTSEHPNPHLATSKYTKDKDFFYSNEISAIELSNYMGHFEREHYDTIKDSTGYEYVPLDPNTGKPTTKTHDLEKIVPYPGGSGTEAERDRLKTITNGTYSFKINEDMESVMDFPPNSWEDTMRDLFRSVNKRFHELSSILKNGNTYVFELQPPKEIADIINEVEMEIYADDGQYVRVYEDYVSNMYHVSKYEPEFVPFIHFFEGDVTTDNKNHGQSFVTDANGNRIPIDINGNVIDTSKYENMSQWIDKFAGWKMANAESEFPEKSTNLYQYINKNMRSSKKTLWYSMKINNYADVNKAVGVIKYTVTEDDIIDFTRLYANYTTVEDNGIGIYMNYNNFFNSPFQTRNKKNNFMTVYKPNTYLSILPGQIGDLNVFVQLKYYNYMGRTCGLKDIPILNYTIKNISDDKPKFSLYNTWCTSTRQIRPSKTAATPNEISAWLKVKWTHMGFDESRPNDPNPLSAYLMEDYTTDTDISAIVTVEAGSPNSQVGFFTCDLIYEFTNPYLELIPDLCSGAIFNLSKQGIINVRKPVELDEKLIGFATTDFTVGFRIKKGAVIDEETMQIITPVDAINFEAKDRNNVWYKHTETEMGGIIMDFRVNGGRKINRFLKLEDYERGEAPNKEYFNGFELGGDRQLIKIYQNKKYTA